MFLQFAAPRRRQAAAAPSKQPYLAQRYQSRGPGKLSCSTTFTHFNTHAHIQAHAAPFRHDTTRLPLHSPKYAFPGCCVDGDGRTRASYCNVAAVTSSSHSTAKAPPAQRANFCLCNNCAYVLLLKAPCCCLFMCRCDG